jgi:hypothetical protein
MKSYESIHTVLMEARREYSQLEFQNLLGANPDERQLYFAKYSLLRKLIGSLDSFIVESQRLRQLEQKYAEHVEQVLESEPTV